MKSRESVLLGFLVILALAIADAAKFCVPELSRVHPEIVNTFHEVLYISAAFTPEPDLSTYAISNLWVNAAPPPRFNPFCYAAGFDPQDPETRRMPTPLAISGNLIINGTVTASGVSMGSTTPWTA